MRSCPFGPRYGAMVIAACLVLLIGFPVSADEQLDQSNEFMSAIAYPVADYQDVGQSFTVGLTGTLSRIEVLLAKAINPTADVTLTVYSTASGVPAAALGNASAPASAVSATTPTFVSFDVSSFQIPVESDDVMAFALSNPGSGLFLMPYESMPSHYSGGNGMYRFTSGNDWQQQSTFDYGFKTYVLAESGDELLGDYNGDQVIDAGDYVRWRNALAGSGTLVNDSSPESIDFDDYQFWKMHYGEPTAGSGGVHLSHVPEPSSVLFLALGLFALAATRFRHDQRRNEQRH